MIATISTLGPLDLHEYREELKDEAGWLIAAELPVTVAEGKNPGAAMGAGWQHQELDSDAAARLIDQTRTPTIGVRLGPRGGIIDFDVDGPDEAKALADLFDGEPPPMPCYTSGREVGEHYWASFDDRLLAIGKATVKYKTEAGEEITVRIGAGDKGAHSVAPPSYHATNDGGWRWTGKRYAWKPDCGLDDIDPPQLPDAVIAKLLSTTVAAPSKAEPMGSSNGSGELTDAVTAMLTSTKSMEDGGDGSKRLFTVCCRAVELDLSDAQAIAAVREYGAEKPFPRAWSDDEIRQRIRDAEKVVTRGSELIFTNGTEVEILDEKGKKKTVVVPHTMPEVRAALDQATQQWPRRVGSALFVDDPAHGIGWLENTEALFGWLMSRRKVCWYGGKQAVARQNLFAELRRTAIAYEAIEKLPHFPAMAGHYYTSKPPAAGDGSTLKRLVDRFTPTTTIDRDLIVAAIATAFWGGRPGGRPAFVITSDAGRGAGKTTLVEMIAHLAGGVLAFEPGEDGEKMKQRLLSPEAVAKRIALVDNVKKTRFSWGDLEALITTPTISGKRLYVGEAQRPNTLSWYVTLNGVALSTDLAQRSVIIKLDKAKYSGIWKDDTLRFIDEHRDDLIADVAGFFQQARCPLEKASRWGGWECDILSRLPEPSEAQAVILERQGEGDADADEGDLIDTHVAQQLASCRYCPERDQVRVPNAVLARWYIEAMGEPMKTPAVTRRLKQMADEGQLKRLKPDPSRSYGRCFIYIGPDADISGEGIRNDLADRLNDPEIRRQRHLRR